jgi:hypothetical protein
MGWTIRTADTAHVVVDLGDWGTVVFSRAPLASFASPIHAVVDGFGFAIEPWNAKAVEAELLKRGLRPVADNDGSEGSQNELMMGDVGDVIIRGGNPLDPDFGKRVASPSARIDPISYGIAPWDTDRVMTQLSERGLNPTIDTSDGNEIHIAQYKGYHMATPNGYNLQISYNTHDARLNLAISVNPRRPGIK